MSLKCIRDYYGVPAKRGGRIRYTGDGGDFDPQDGTITSASGPHLMVRFDIDGPNTRIRHKLHPTWEVEYLTEGQK